MTIEKVVSFRASSIGDCLMAKYLFENVRASYPRAKCAVVVGGRGAMIQDLFAAYPWIEVVEANRRSPRAVFDLIKRYRNSDLVTTLYTGGTVNLSTKLVARLLARRGALVGFDDPSPLNRLLFDVALPTHGRSGVPRLHERAVLEAAHIPVATDTMTFSYVPQPQLLSRLALEKGKYVVVGLFSGADARGLSPQKKQELINALAQVFPRTTLVFIGTSKERKSLTALSLPSGARTPETSVQEAAALIDASLGMVSLGTGTSHIAAHLRVPLAVLVACQGRQWVGKEQFGDAPIRVLCKPEACPKSGHDYSTYAPCINAVDMDEVARGARELFTSSGRFSG